MLYYIEIKTPVFKVKVNPRSFLPICDETRLYNTDCTASENSKILYVAS